jgi:uncharacterized protein (DUF885 family)
MIDRRQLLAAAAALAASPAALRAEPANPAEAELARLLDRFFYEGVDESPQRATSLGFDKGERAALKGQLDDGSAAGKARRLERARARLKALQALNADALGPAARVDRDVVAYQLETTVNGGERFRFGSVGNQFTPYVISQKNGAYQEVPDFLDNQHRIDARADAETYLQRVRAFAVALDQDLDRAKAETAAGVVPPDFVLDTTLAQLNALRGVPAGQTVLVQSLARKLQAAKLDGAFAAQAEALVASEVFPALDRQIAFVRALRPKATHDAGVWKLPEGQAYYAAALAAGTTTRLTPAQVHQLGLEQVAEITGRIDQILKAQGMRSGSVGARLTALNDDPKQLYPNTDEGRAALLDQLNAQIERMYGMLPRAFAAIPSTKVTVKRVPPFIQDGASNGYYQRAALDGSRPAIYFINLKDTHDWPKFSLPTLTYHEAVPGHHLQISIQQNSTSIPLIRRTGGFSAYTEGWALYAEQVADEIGAYKDDPLGRAGYLQSFLFRAVRLVVDTGIHDKRWSREQAIDYMAGATGYARGRVEREVDRYCVTPGQACSYKVGHTVWARLRQEAQSRLGAKFDLRSFHGAALANGAMPLTVLEGVIGRWVAAQAA